MVKMILQSCLNIIENLVLFGLLGLLIVLMLCL